MKRHDLQYEQKGSSLRMARAEQSNIIQTPALGLLEECFSLGADQLSKGQSWAHQTETSGFQCLRTARLQILTRTPVLQ